MKLSCLLPIGVAWAGKDLLWVPAQYEPGFVDTSSVQGQEATLRTTPSAVFHGRVVDLPPYAEPMILPAKGTYPLGAPPAVQSLAPFSDWEFVEYIEPLGWVYRRLVDSLEFLITNATTSPIIRREGITLQDAYELANLKEAKAVENTTEKELLTIPADAPLYEALPKNLASAVKAVCNGQLASSVNPLCVGADLWRTLASAEDTDGVIEVVEVIEQLPQTTERFADLERSATAGLLRTISNLLSAPLQVLSGVYQGVTSATESLTTDLPLRDRARRFGVEGRVLGVIASAVESSGIFALLDSALAHQAWARSGNQHLIPLRVLRSWAETIDRAIIDVNQRTGELAARGLLVGPTNIFTRPLHYLNAQVRRLVLRTPVVIEFAETIAPRLTHPIAETVASHFGIHPPHPAPKEDEVELAADVAIGVDASTLR